MPLTINPPPRLAPRMTDALQQIAMTGLETITDQLGYELTEMTEAKIKKAGDTLALFVWREVGDADGDVNEAIRMMERAKEDLDGVIKTIREKCPV